MDRELSELHRGALDEMRRLTPEATPDDAGERPREEEQVGREDLVDDDALTTYEADGFDLELRRIVHDTDPHGWSRIDAHFVVYDTDGDREFVGDYTVRYGWNHRHGHYWASDYEEVRAAGGIYADGADPSPGMLREGADLVAKFIQPPVHHRFR